MVSSRHLANLRAPELPSALTKDSIIVLPLGAIEQHGPHLPLNTDFVVADEVSKAAVETVGEETNAWLLPTLPFTKSNEHAWSAGTMWLSATTLMAVLDDIARSVASTSARKLLFINGHGGNSALTAMMNREIRLKWGLQTFLAHPHMPADQGGSSAESELGMGVHGGMDETSVMLHLRPELVDMSVA
ncbi:MAG: creatininase family protein, partial [Acidimicrobiaceae bacterium]